MKNKTTLRAYLEGKDLFSEIKALEDFPFIGNDSETLNTMLIVNYGDRIVFNPYNDLSINVVAAIVVKSCKEKWNNYILLESIKTGATESRTLTETTNNDETKVVDSENINSVSGFNSDELIDDNKNTNDSTDTLNAIKTRTLSDDSTNANKAYELLNSNIKHSIINCVLKDVSINLTLSIY